MIETIKPRTIFERINDLCQDHDRRTAYLAYRLYLGSSEYNELRFSYSRNVLGPAQFNLLPPLQGYEQGALQFLGKTVFVLKDIQSHLAIA
jgi:hypothetical protein